MSDRSGRRQPTPPNPSNPQPNPLADPMVEFEQTLAQLRVLAEGLRRQSGAPTPPSWPVSPRATAPSAPDPTTDPTIDPATDWRTTGPGDSRVDTDPGVEPTDCDREIVLLLAAGATDETIARRLGISARTVQRRVQALMTTLGVRTRFQAGVQAALRNWC